MTQKSLVYMVIAVTVGYILVSTIPQQLSMYTTPQRMLETDAGNMTLSTEPPLNDMYNNTDTLSDSKELTAGEETREQTLLERNQISELAKWWTLDIGIALIIYWVAKQRLS